MFGLSTVKLASYGITALAVCAALFFAYSWAFDRGVASMQPRLVAAQETAAKAVSANNDNLNTISQLQAANAAFQQQAHAQVSAAQAQVQELQQANAALSAQAGVVHQTIRTVYLHNASARVCGSAHPPASLPSLYVAP